jgi:gamma-glutamyltranspeptidase/glutathione hydrolase
MSPTIVLRDGKPWLAVGAAGGPKIISSVLNVLLYRLDGGLSLPDAMKAVRLHHQWQPDEIVTNRRPAPAVVEGLLKRGHRFAEKHGSGQVEALAIEDGQYIGVSDPGKGGGAATTKE